MITIADFQKLLNNQCSTQEYKSFDILKYKNYICFKGEIIKDNEYENFKYNSKFPTKWLYEDFERSLEEDVKKYKVEQLLGIVSK